MTTSTPHESAPAPDQTDRAIIAAAEEEGIGCPCDVLVLDDATGALTAFALATMAEHEDGRVITRASSRALTTALAARFAEALASGRLVLATAGEEGTEPAALAEAAAAGEGCLTVLARLPKSLRALEDTALALAGARSGDGERELTLVAGGRVKHMTRSQNEVLARAFTEVRGGRGVGKSRALIASGVREDAPAPRAQEGGAEVAVLGERRTLALRAHGGVFGGAAADAGSLLLLDALDEHLRRGTEGIRSAIDLGSGNGLLTAYLAAALPGARVRGSDDDADAVLSTRATLAANGLDRDGVDVLWEDALERTREEAEAAAELDDLLGDEDGPGAAAPGGVGGVDLVVLNPPFHDGTAVDATLVQDLLDAAARVLRPGGELWLVHNSSLRYRAELARRIGAVHERARDRRFTVLSARRR